MVAMGRSGAMVTHTETELLMHPILRPDVDLPEKIEDDLPKTFHKKMPRQTPVIALTLLVLLAVVLRFGLYAVGPAQDIERTMQHDSTRFVALADNLASTGQFGLTDESPGTQYHTIQTLRVERGEKEPRLSSGLYPETMRTPGYPAFLAAFQRLGLSQHWALWVQILLCAWAVPFAYGLVCHLTDRPLAGLIAASVTLLHPAAVLYSNTLMSEAVFVPLLIIGLFFVIWGRDLKSTKASLSAVMLGGLVLGIAALVKPVAMLIPVALGMWMIATRLRWMSFPIAGVCVLGALLAMGPWMMRNAQVGYAPRLTHVDGLHHFTKTTAFMRMQEQGKTKYPQDWLAELDVMFAELPAQMEPNETVYAAMKRVAVEHITSHPKTYGLLMADSMAKLMTDHSMPVVADVTGTKYQPTGLRDAILGRAALTGDINFMAMALPLMWVGFNAMLTLMMAIGFVRLAIAGRWSALLLLGGLAFYFAFATQAHGMERTRLPMLIVQAAAVGALFAVSKTRTIPKPEKQVDSTKQAAPLETAQAV